MGVIFRTCRSNSLKAYVSSAATLSMDGAKPSEYGCMHVWNCTTALRAYADFLGFSPLMSSSATQYQEAR